MAKRQPPEVLGDLITERRETLQVRETQPEHHKTSVEQSHQTEAIVYRHENLSPPRGLQQSKQIDSLLTEDAEVGKTKATFYLSREITQELEDTWIHLRRRAGRGRPTSKSVLVEAALKLTLSQLREKGVDTQTSP
jgi:hypothetical protein